MIAQMRASIEHSGFDVPGRYEARLTRQVLQFTRKIEHLREDRRRQESIDSWRQRHEKKTDNLESASFGKTVPELETSQEMQA
jgi:hypothetical protein